MDKICLRVVILILFIINIPVVFAPGYQYTDSNGDRVSADYGSDNFYSDPNVDYNDPNIDWNQFDQSKVPPDRVNEIPADKVKVNAIKDQSKLTFEQLSYGDNYNRVGDKSKLDSDVRDRFLSEKTNRDVKTELPPDTKGTAEYDSFTFDKVDTLQMDNNIVSGATNVVYSNGILTADHADSYVNTGSISSNIDYLEVQPTVFKVKKADSVISGCIEVNDAENSEFKIYSNAVVVKTENGTEFNVTDCDRNEVEFSAMENDSNITITKATPPRYKISRGILKNTRGNITESIIGNNTVIAEMGLLGFRCMHISPVGSYYYTETIEKDFGISIPMENNETYRLCLRKLSGEDFESDGLVDFVDNRITLNKIAYYRS